MGFQQPMRSGTFLGAAKTSQGVEPESHGGRRESPADSLMEGQVFTQTGAWSQSREWKMETVFISHR